MDRSRKITAQNYELAIHFLFSHFPRKTDIAQENQAFGLIQCFS